MVDQESSAVIVFVDDSRLEVEQKFEDLAHEFNIAVATPKTFRVTEGGQNYIVNPLQVKYVTYY